MAKQKQAGTDYKPLLADDPKERCCAVLTLKDAGEWSPDGRAMIANWLREQAKGLLKDGKNYAPRFRARYMAARP